MSDLHGLLMIGVIAGVTVLLRFLPFFIFGERKTPAFLTYLGNYLPYAVMAMLVVYCLKGISFAEFAGWMPSAAAVAVVVGLHLWKKNTLLSIVGGTICYMLLL